MDPTERRFQLRYNSRARRWLEGSIERFLAWEIVIMFYDIVVLVDGYAEMTGSGPPMNHAARRAFVERHLPRLFEMYDELYSLGLTARYYNEYSMTKTMWRKAVQCHAILVKGVPTQ